MMKMLRHQLHRVLGMARGNDPDSAGSQFYIMLSPRKTLDGKYAVFGQVIAGMDVVQKIAVGDMITRVTVKP